MKLTASGVEVPDRTARWLWQFVSGMSTHEWLLSLEDEMDAALWQRFWELVERRAMREPLQYIVGSTAFSGIEFLVDSRVLIPRPETELIVQTAYMYCRKWLSSAPLQDLAGVCKQASPLQICDVGTGSGAIAISLAISLLRDGYTSGFAITATDLSRDALAVAQKNAQRQGVEACVHFVQADLLQENDTGTYVLDTVDVLLANLPYIPEGDRSTMQQEVVAWEPLEALFAGVDGLDAYRRLARQAQSLLSPNGLLLWEIGKGQTGAVRALVKETWPSAQVEWLLDQQGIERVAVVHTGACC